IKEEYYFSILLDRANRTYLAMASVEGGMDIEQLAEERPEDLARVEVSPTTGINREVAEKIAAEAKFDPAMQSDVADVLVELGEVKRNAADAKVTVDDNAEFRQPGHAELVDERTENPLEAKAEAKGLNYVKLDGSVGVIGNGAGLVMSTLDVVAYAGEKHGNVK